MTVTTERTESQAELFRRRRQELGLTLEQVAREAGLAYSTVVRTEQGQRITRASTAAAIGRVLGVTT